MTTRRSRIACSVAVPSSGTGYVHLVGIDPDHRRRRVGKALYEHFAEACKREGLGKLKAIGVASAQRHTAAPDIPTIAEQALPGFEAMA